MGMLLLVIGAHAESADADRTSTATSVEGLMDVMGNSEGWFEGRRNRVA
jgi:hypothetical protein